MGIWVSVPVLFLLPSTRPARKKVHSPAGLWIPRYCFSTKLTRTSKVNMLKGYPLHPADPVVPEFRSRSLRLLSPIGRGAYHHFLRFWVLTKYVKKYFLEN